MKDYSLNSETYDVTIIDSYELDGIISVILKGRRFVAKNYGGRTNGKPPFVVHEMDDIDHNNRLISAATEDEPYAIYPNGKLNAINLILKDIGMPTYQTIARKA